MRGYINASEQLAEIQRQRTIRRNEALDRATFTAADYGKRYVYRWTGVRGRLEVRFPAFPDNGTAVFYGEDGIRVHVTPDEVTRVR